MKRSVILPIVAIILLAVYAGPYLLLLLLIIPIADFFMRKREKIVVQRIVYANVEEVKEKYGEPDDVVSLDATRANELQFLILFYSVQDKMIVVGEEMRISDLNGVTSKNMATPYTIDQYAVILNTNNPYRPSIQLRVGFDACFAGEIAAQIDKHLHP